MPTLSLAAATSFAASLLEAAGAPTLVAQSVAAHLADADACGYPSHGLSLLPSYIDDLVAGRIDPRAHGRWVLEAGPLLVFDAEHGFGRPLVEGALKQAIAVAVGSGAAVLAVRQSHHLGRLGAYAEIAAATDLAVLMFANVVGRDPMVAPAGAREARFSTNPIAIAVPSLPGAPVLLDIATSGIAMNKARVAQMRGEHVAPGLLIDAAGQPTDDPAVMTADPRGALLPFGGHKGSGLGMLAELLAGALTGGGTIAPVHPRDGATLNNLFCVLIDPQRLNPGQWRDEVAAMLAYLHSDEPIDPSQPVQAPGEPEAHARAAATRDGISYEVARWSPLTALAGQLAVDVPHEA